MSLNNPPLYQVSPGYPARNWYEKLSDEVSVKDFGAVGNGIADDQQAIESARTYALSIGAELVFPAGIYAHSQTLAFGFNNLRIRAQGLVTLKHTGTGKAVTIDGGQTGSGIYKVRFIGFDIQGNAGTTDALYIRAAHHLKIDAKAKTACQTGMRVEWSVLSEFFFTVSLNEEIFTVTPSTGMHLDKRAFSEETAYCTFYNPIIEGPETGAVFGATLGNIIQGGAMEACGTGAYLGSGATGNKFFGTDFEANTNNDVVIEAPTGPGANFNEFHGVDTAKRFYIASGNGNKVIGGQNEIIRIDSGSNNQFLNTNFNRNGSGSFDDNAPVKRTNVMNSAAGTYLPNT